MKISTKYIIEFSTENLTESIAICDTMSSVEKYLLEKFNFTEKDIYNFNDEGYLLTINLDYGKMRVRKIDFVEN